MSDFNSSLPRHENRFALLIHQASDWISCNHKKVGWLFAALLTFFAAGVCTTIRVNESFLDVVQLRLLVMGLALLATTQVLVAFRIVKARAHFWSWLSMAIVFYGCVILT
ncbi:MAG: hypothetical protein HUJ26_10980 [Planctomycetaceae bacterium]|nr:hypothetical protein [Planctomycetaceae bacterium]